MQTAQDIIAEMVRRIVEEFDPHKIVLFGSYARGLAGPDSDVDLLVVMPVRDSRRQQTVAIRTRLIARSDKRFHFMQFMINETKNQLAATFEALITHADLKIRRAAPMPAEIIQRFDATLSENDKLDWEPPISGAIKP